MSLMKDVLPAIFTGGLSLPFTMLMNGGEKEAAPAVIAPSIMPEADDDAIRKTRQQAMVAQQQRQGRASTMLSDSYDKLG